MATDPAPASRRLWQLPTFLVGLGAFIALWQYGDRIRPTLAERYEKAMVALRPAVDRWPPDPDQVRAALRKVPDAEPPAEMAPRVKYLTGSAYVALAEAMPDAESKEMWAKARRDLEAAADQDMPLPDQKKLRYRLARAWAHCDGTDSTRTIDFLTKYASAGDDPSEAYRLLADLHRKSVPPDEAAERDDWQNFLKHATMRADARTLNGARIRLAELQTKLGQSAEAPKVLERIGPDAPPDLHAAAKLKLADLRVAAQDWAGAVPFWEAVRDMKGATEDQRAEAKERLEQFAVMNGRGGAELTHGDSPESRAAWFRRAERALGDATASKDAAVVNLERAFAGEVPEGLKKFVKDKDSRIVCEAVFQRAFADSDFALAVRAAKVIAKALPTDPHHRFLIQAHENWAKDADRDPTRTEEAKEHYRAAADACEAAALADQTTAGKADWLRKAAPMFLKAGDRPKALQVLTTSASHLADYPEDRVGLAWAEIGDVFRAAGDMEQARIAYQNAAGHSGPAQDRSVIPASRMEYEADPVKGGAAAIKSLQELIARKPAADPALFEEALYLLGEIHLVRKEWGEADKHLKSALDAYPASSRAARGHYHYGQVQRHFAYEAARKIKTDRAAIEQIKAERLTAKLPALKVDEQIKLEDRLAVSQKTYESMMRGAYEEFRKAEEMFLSSPSAADPGVLKRTSFWAADCAFWVGEYADCAARCEKLAVRYRGRVEELEAQRDLHRCCTFAGQFARDSRDDTGATAWSKRATDVIDRIKDALTRLPASEFEGAGETHKKGYWDSWLVENSTRK